MALTNSQHILHELQASEPLTEQQLQSALRGQQIDISLESVGMELSQLIKAGWIEYYGTQNEDGLAEEDIVVAYELCNRWWNLEESERERILVN
jgi:hypothetical protein